MPSTPAARGALDVVALAASAGGLAALIGVLERLPPDFPAPIVVVQHLDPRHPSLMADILGRRTRLRVKQADQGDVLTPGTVFVAPPGRHLCVNADGSLSLTDTALIHFVRPSADTLFASVAASFGARAVAVVLSGMGADGTNGARAVKDHGGTVIVQDQETSEYFGMPGAVIRAGCADLVLPLDRISSALVALAAGGTP